MRAVLGLVVLYVFAVLTVPGQWLDDEFFGLAQRAAVGPMGEWLPFLARDLLPVAMAVALVVVCVLALLRRRWADAVAGGSVVLMSVPLSRLLREWLPRPDHGYSYLENTLPSTHVTLVAAAAVAILLMWPSQRPRWLATALGVVVGLACVGNVVGHAHRPSDAVASVLLVVTVVASVRAACAWASTRPDRLP